MREIASSPLVAVFGTAGGDARPESNQALYFSTDPGTFQRIIELLRQQGVEVRSAAAPPAERQNQASDEIAPRTPGSAGPGQTSGTTFQEASVTGPGGPLVKLNSAYFAAAQTAGWLAERYGTGEVVEVPYAGEGGPFRASAKERHIRLTDGRLVNAGLLADYFRRNPESTAPGVADRLIRQVLENDRGRQV